MFSNLGMKKMSPESLTADGYNNTLFLLLLFKSPRFIPMHPLLLWLSFYHMIAFTDQTAANVVRQIPAKCCALRHPFYLLDIYLLWGDESWAGLLEAQVRPETCDEVILHQSVPASQSRG